MWSAPPPRMRRPPETPSPARLSAQQKHLQRNLTESEENMICDYADLVGDNINALLNAICHHLGNRAHLGCEFLKFIGSIK